LRAMVLAAGRGERLRPLTDSLPKPMIPVAGKPLIFHTLAYLKNCGIEEVVVNLHHLGEVIQEYVGDGRPWGLRVFYSWERELLGTGGGIQKAAPHLFQEAFVVINADILVELNLQRVLQYHRENNAAVTMVLRRDPEVDRYGAIETDGFGLVRQFLGKLPVGSGPWNRLMFTGVHVLEPVVFAYMNQERTSFSIVDVYLAMLRAGERILGYEMKGFWTDLGTRARYEGFLRMLEERKITIEALVQGCRGSVGREARVPGKDA
jgi:mannose-1-phosphate guanylyltransferase